MFSCSGAQKSCSHWAAAQRPVFRFVHVMQTLMFLLWIALGSPFGRAQTVKESRFKKKNVGASIARLPKNGVFRIFRREIIVFSPCGGGFCSGKIHGRPMVAPTPSKRVHSSTRLRISASSAPWYSFPSHLILGPLPHMRMQPVYFRVKPLGSFP